jgi:hypothetical protein
VYIYLCQQHPLPPDFALADVRPTLESVAQGLDTASLVVHVGVTNGTRWRGTYHGLQTPAAWPHLRDVAKPPGDLPPRFALVTLLFGAEGCFPYERVDKYGWTWTCGAFKDMVAWVLAHECYHFGAHQWPDVFPGQDWRDEQAANAWALAHATALGFAVEAEPPATGVAHG